jgi:hypothetical protein
LEFVENDARAAGFRVARIEDPFITRASDTMSLLVAVADPHGRLNSATPNIEANIDSTAALIATPLRQTDEAASLSNPGLRMPSARFKQLRDNEGIVVVDVRTATEYRSAHIPGAISVPFDRIGDEVEHLRGFGKPIITYCS